MLAFQNRMVITVFNAKGDYPESPCLSLSDIESGFRNDQLQFIIDKSFESGSSVFIYYRRGGEITDLTINKIRFMIPNSTEYCSQSTTCVKALLDLPYVAQDSFLSSQTIISSAHLPPDMKLFLQAKTAVELGAGFQVDISNRLKVIMEDCTPSSICN